MGEKNETRLIVVSTYPSPAHYSNTMSFLLVMQEKLLQTSSERKSVNPLLSSIEK